MSALGKIKKLIASGLCFTIIITMLSGMNIIAAEAGIDAVPVNLVLNHSFENGTETPLNWSFTNAKTMGSWAWDAEKYYDGLKSVKLTTTSATDRAVFFQQYITIKPDSSYSLSAFYCTDNTMVQPFITITWYTPDKKFIISKTMDGVKGKIEWTKLVMEATAPANAGLAYISVQSKGAAGNVWFDLAEMTELIPPANLAANPGFESGSAQPDNWTFSNVNTNGTWVWDTSIKYEGEKSVRLTTVNSTDRAFFSQQYIPIKPGHIYQYSVRYHTENMTGQPFISVTWYSVASSSGFISAKTVNCEKTADGWNKVVFEGEAPDNANYMYISVQSRLGAGSIWFDDICLKEIDVSCESGPGNDGILNADFELGAVIPEVWLFDNDRTDGKIEWDSSIKYSGNKSVSLAVYGNDDIAHITQKNIRVDIGKMLEIKSWYKTDNMSGTPYLKAYWYSLEGTFLGSSTVTAPPSEDWSGLSLRCYPPANSAKFTLQLGLEDGGGKVWFDNVSYDLVLLNCEGEIVPVTGVEDINEQLSPLEFWFKMPAVNYAQHSSSVWSQNVIRNFFFGPIEGEQSYLKFTLPQLVNDMDNNVPVINNGLGSAVDPAMPLVKAGDIQYQPFMEAHAGYSNKYYPRRMHDYLMANYNPAYILTGDSVFRTRAEELLGFLKMSQWTLDGANLFTSTFYPAEYKMHPEWYGGWDYLFDWKWKDGYGYTWDLHEPDHHVNSQMASAIINSYETYGNPEYLEMARTFVYNQIPRYGFHKGVWNNETYYWTEYNPTGYSIGNPVNDATDNVVALVAEAVAKVAYYETDETLKKQMLEFARGLLWYMVREFESDGRWYYNGAENPLNYNNKKISHDQACILPSLSALVYLHKAGVDTQKLLQGFEPVLESYIDMWGMYQRKAYMQVVKLYDGIPEPDTTLKFSTFVQVTGENLNQVRFSDTFSDDFIKPEAMNLRISHILPPDAANPNWNINPEKDIVVTVTPEQLKDGVIIPFSMNKWDVYKLTYEVTTKSTFDRTKAIDKDSALFTWIMDEADNATFIKSTSGNTGYALNSFTLPLNRQMTINSSNFLSFGARIIFPFAEEISSVLVESASPAPASYIHDSNWGNIGAQSYIYPIHSLLPEVSGSGEIFSNEAYHDRGKVYNSNGEGDYAELEFETFRPSVEYTVLANYLTANNRGTVKLMVDGVQQGNDYDQYASSATSLLSADINHGKAEIGKGKHKLIFVVTGKNALSKGYTIGLYDAIVLQPSRPALNTETALADLRAGDQTIEGFASEKLEYSIELPFRSTPLPVITANTADKNAAAVITLPNVLPGAAVISVTAEDGITVNDYKILLSYKDPTIQGVTFLIDTFSKDGSITGALVPQLTNTLDQADHKLKIGSKDQAVKHLQDFLRHLNNPDMSQNVTDQTKETLEAEVKALIDFLQ